MTVRAVIDANIVTSRAIMISGPSGQIGAIWDAGGFVWLASEAIFREYERVLRYDRVRRYTRMAHADVSETIRGYREGCESVVVSEPIPRVSVDPKDDIYLACAVAGRADYIVSGDRHLLDLGSYQGIPIVTPAAFVALLGAEPA